MPSIPALAANVYVVDPTTFERVYLAAGTVPADWAARQITNPSAWVGGVAPYPAGTLPAPVKQVTGTTYANLAALPVLTAQDVGLLARTTDGGMYEWDGTAWRLVESPFGTYVPTTAAGTGSAVGRTVTAAITGTPVADSGLIGFTLARDATGNPLGFSLASVAGTPTYDVMTLDNLTDDLVFVYDHALPGGGSGDQLRWRRPGHLLFGRSVAQPANTYRFRIDVVAADPSTITDNLVLTGISTGTTGGAGSMRLLRIFNEANELFNVQGAVGTSGTKGVVGIGLLTPIEFVHIARGQNDRTQVLVQNTTAGTASKVSLRLQSDAKSVFLEQFSSTFTTASLANTAMLYTNSTPLLLGTNSTERARIDANGNIILGTAALATTATDKFVSLPSMAGTPTGTPTLVTGMVPLAVDTTGSNLWAYIGGAWKSVALA